jgi:hypothetical protein
MLRILELMILLRPYTICHKFWLFTGFARAAGYGGPYRRSGTRPIFLLPFATFFCLLLLFSAFHYHSTGFAQDSQRDADYGVPYVTGSAT